MTAHQMDLRVGFTLTVNLRQAISVSTSQGCKVYFGGEYDPLRYAPPGYKGIASLTSTSGSLVLPPPHIKLPPTPNPEDGVSRRGSASSGLSGISSVAATEDEAISIEDKGANVESTISEQNLLPIDNDGNVEPNLVPVDKVSPWDTTPMTATSEQPHPTTNDEHDLDICSYDWSFLLPSLYFEVELHFRRMSEFDLSDGKRWYVKLLLLQNGIRKGEMQTTHKLIQIPFILQVRSRRNDRSFTADGSVRI